MLVVVTCFVSELEEVLPDLVRLLGAAGLLVHAVQGEPGLAYMGYEYNMI